MSTMSIDDLYEKIYHPHTKEYFQEVRQSYVGGSYRSATVMLYSIVISDLVYKLKELKEQYEDETAINILEEITDLREQNSKSSEWEKDLYDKVFERTNLLELQDKENIDFLKNQRNLSAHPVLNESDLLFNPNKDQVKAHMRNMLEGVLTKPSILSKKLFDNFVVDVARVKNTLVKEGELERYLYTKYFQHLSPLLIKRIFKSLWKLVFKLENPDCNENRDINFMVIKIMLKRRKQELFDYMKEERNHFSDISESSDLVKYLVLLCNEHSIFPILQEHAQVIIQAKAESNINIFINAPFLSDSMAIHLNVIKDKINEGFFTYTLSESEINFLEKLSYEHSCLDEFYELLISNFGSSGSFDTADRRFELCIAPYLRDFSDNHFYELLKLINGNSQLHNRGRAIHDNRIIKEYADQKVIEDFDYESLHFFRY